jgi:5-methyltetrahydropteroyltriglutamate--homocysteine methyltransferase
MTDETTTTAAAPEGATAPVPDATTNTVNGTPRRARAARPPARTAPRAASTATGTSRVTTLLPTTVIGSWSVPDWLERAKTGVYHGTVSRSQLADMHDMAVKAVLKDQEVAGIDIVSDGEMRRENDVDYLLSRFPGVEATDPLKSFYFDYLDLRLTRPLPEPDPGPLGLVPDLRFTKAHTDRPVRFSVTGPFSLSRRLRCDPALYRDRTELVRALARVLNAEAAALAAAGAELLQIDEPLLAGHPEDVALAVEAVNIVTKDVPVTWALHVCYGNRYARPLWEGHYDFLFPAVLDAAVDQLLLEFARKGDEDLRLVERYQWDRVLGVGVLDVKTEEVEPVEVVERRIERALEVLPPSRILVTPDCGLRHVPADAARAKLRAMTTAAAAVRGRLQKEKKDT